jgi:invasion protein IalB
LSKVRVCTNDPGKRVIALRRTGWCLAGSLFGLVALCHSGVQAFETRAEVKKIRAFGDWDLFCEAKALARCALVQNVSGENTADPQAWAKSSLEFNGSRHLLLTLRFDRSVKTESGVAIRIDDKPVGVASFFECDNEYCKATLELAKNDSVNEFGTLFELGKKLSVDFRVTDDSGYRLSLNLDHVRDGIYALKQSVGSNGISNFPMAQAPSNSIVGSFGAVLVGETSFKVEAVQLKDSFDWTNNTTATSTPTADYSNMFTSGCSLRPKESALETMVTVGPDLQLSHEEINKIIELAKKSKECQSHPQYFVVIAYDSGRPRSDLGVSGDTTLSGVYRGFKQAQELQLISTMGQAGIPANRVLRSVGSEISPVMVYDQPSWVNIYNGQAK